MACKVKFYKITQLLIVAAMSSAVKETLALAESGVAIFSKCV